MNLRIKPFIHPTNIGNYFKNSKIQISLKDILFIKKDIENKIQNTTGDVKEKLQNTLLEINRIFFLKENIADNFYKILNTYLNNTEIK